MARSNHRGGIGKSDEVPTLGDCGAGDEDVHYREVSNRMEKIEPEFGQTIPDGATRLFPDARESPCIV